MVVSCGGIASKIPQCTIDIHSYTTCILITQSSALKYMYLTLCSSFYETIMITGYPEDVYNHDYV